jgi:hypothetical protein
VIDRGGNSAEECCKKREQGVEIFGFFSSKLEFLYGMPKFLMVRKKFKNWEHF